MRESEHLGNIQSFTSMTVTYKHCESYRKGDCELELLRWGYNLPCCKSKNCKDFKAKKGYDRNI